MPYNKVGKPNLAVKQNLVMPLSSYTIKTSMYFVAYMLKYLSRLPKRKKYFVEVSDVTTKFLSEVSDVKLQ